MDTSNEPVKKQYVSFFIDAQMFGIDIKLINEVNTNTSIIPIPLSDPHIRGYVNVRGQVVLVIDLSIVLGKKQQAVTPKSHIIIFKTMQDFIRLQTMGHGIDFSAFGDKPAAIIVDVIGDVVSIHPDQVETPTHNMKNDYSRFVDGIVKLQDNLLILVNPVQVLTYKGKNENVE